MTEPEAVTRARQWLAGSGWMRSLKLVADLLAAYDDLAASVRDREAAAWDACYQTLAWREAMPHGDPHGEIRNPYRDKEN